MQMLKSNTCSEDVGEEALERSLGHEDGAPWMKLVSLQKQPHPHPQSSLPTFHPSDFFHQQGVYHLQPEEGVHQNLTLLEPWSWTSSLQNCDISIFVLYKPPSLQYFL